MRRTVLLLTVMGVVLLLAVGTPRLAQAQEAPPPKSTYSWPLTYADSSRTAVFRTYPIVCKWGADGRLDLGGAVFMKEYRKSGITQFRVQYLLYALNDSPRPNALDPSELRTKIASPKFPNNYLNVYWAPQKNYQKFPSINPLYGYVLRAKMTWVKPHRPDINKTVDIGRCNGGSGYVKKQYYR